MSKILIVEDSEQFQKLIARALGNYETVVCGTAEEALILLNNNAFDLALVDINLPQKDGYYLLSEMHSHPNLCDIPVLCLTGRKEITDKVTAFSLGADDYITKPFDPIELQARVDSKLKKIARHKNNDLLTSVGPIEIDHSRHRVAIFEGEEKKEVNVTQTEFKILACLARRPEQVYTRDQLLVAAWGENAKVLERVVDAHVCLLRKKLGPRGKCIRAVTGVGYKLVPEVKKKAA